MKSCDGSNPTAGRKNREGERVGPEQSGQNRVVPARDIVSFSFGYDASGLATAVKYS